MVSNDSSGKNIRDLIQPVLEYCYYVYDNVEWAVVFLLVINVFAFFFFKNFAAYFLAFLNLIVLVCLGIRIRSLRN